MKFPDETPFAVTFAPMKKVKIKLNKTVKQPVIKAEILNPTCTDQVLDFG